MLSVNRYSYKSLKHAAKYADISDDAPALVVLGDSATQLLANAIQGQVSLCGMPLRVIDTDYDQIDLQVFDSESTLYTCGAQYALLYLCVEKLWLRFCECSPTERSEFAEIELSRIVRYWEQITSTGIRVLHTTFAEYNDGVYGQFAAKESSSFIFQLRKLNYLLGAEMAQRGGVLPIDVQSIQNRMGRNNIFSSKFWYSARISAPVEVLPEMARAVVSMINAANGSVAKCVVCDLDNTMWGGVIGDDGLEGIQIGELGDGPAFGEFQQWLKQLERRGVVLAVCSKNEEKTAREPFEQHPEMVLRLDDFAIFVANWQDKPSNIRYIQETLNIGMDSIVFLDDNPFERESVRALLPDVVVPELPVDPADWISFLSNSGLFETASASSGDANRTKQYQAEAGRRELAASYDSFDDYLEGLGMVAEAMPFDQFNFPRIAQLTQRSNQFNLRTKRYSEADVASLAENDGFVTIYFTLRDKFGDHGLVSVVVLEKRENGELFIDTLLMSCRVLKRGMEEFVINKIVSTADDLGFTKVVGEYLPTKKNVMVSDLYSRMGFRDIGNGLFEADVSKFTKLKNHIEEEGR